MGLSIQSLGQNNSQYISNANLEISKIEKENTKTNIKDLLSTSINMVSFVIAGIICIVLNFIL